MRVAMRRVGLSLPAKGSHALRHTAATRLLRSGATIKEISDILRHKNINSTFIYTKVDLATLAEVPSRWPAASR